MATAEISAIERLRCGTDGEGIRTLIGFSGCPLRCKYCPNKFTYDGTHQPKVYTVTELIEKVMIDKLYFAATGGGITFGGGEPLLHEKFIEEFMKTASKNDADHLTDNFVIETSLSVPKKKLVYFLNSIKKNDFLFHDHKTVLYIDVKTLDPKEYKKYTGKSIRNLIGNLKYLTSRLTDSDYRLSLKIVIRVPKIKGYVSEESIKKTTEKLRKMSFYDIEEFEYKVFE